MTAHYFCPFCGTEINEKELKEEINEQLRVCDIDIRDTISVLVDALYLRCTKCGKEIRLGEDGLFVQRDKAAPKVKMRVEVTG